MSSEGYRKFVTRIIHGKVRDVINVREYRGVFPLPLKPEKALHLEVGSDKENNKIQDLVTKIKSELGEYSLVRVADAVVRIPQTEILDCTESFLHKTVWTSTDERSEAMLSATRSKRAFGSRIAVSLIDCPTDETNKKALEMLREDFEKTAVIPRKPTTAQLTESWYKTIFGINTVALIELRRELFGEMDEGREGFMRTVKKQVDSLASLLSGISLDDLSLYIHFETLFLPMDRFLHVDRAASEEGSYTGASKYINALSHIYIADNLRPIHDEHISAWERLEAGWGEKEIVEALRILSTVGNPTVADNVIAALESNLLAIISVHPEGMDTLGVKKLLSHRWAERTGVLKNYPKLNENGRVEEYITFPGFSIPRKYLPSAAIELLAAAKRCGSQEAFRQLLSRVHEEVEADGQAVTPWVLTLIILKAQNPELSDLLSNAIFSLKGIQEPFRDVLLDRAPGKLFVTEEGKLRLRGLDSVLSSAFPVYTSSIEPQRPKPVEVKPVEVEVLSAREYATSQARIVSFFGEVGQVEKEDVGEVLADLFWGKQHEFSEDELLSRFEDFSKKYVKGQKYKGNLLFSSHFLSEDGLIQEARNIGIEAVLLQEDEALFVLSKDAVHIRIGDRKMQAGFSGSFDTVGQLHVDGIDIGDPEQLFLNSVALYCATMEFWGSTGLLDREQDRALYPMANRYAADFNRSTIRQSHPKIGIQGGRPYIVGKPDGFELPVLFSEIAK